VKDWIDLDVLQNRPNRVLTLLLAIMAEAMDVQEKINNNNNTGIETDTIEDFLGKISDDNNDEETGSSRPATYAEISATRQNDSQIQNNINRKDRTFTFYNLMTFDDITENVITTLSEHFGQQPSSVIEKIQRNTRHRSRYNAVFKSMEQMHKITEEGISVNGVRVRGS